MKNLKRVLSLALASLMLVGTMVVGAGAVDVDDFTDKGEIKHTEAVSTLVALNVINGKDDGRFDPTGSLTRAEMAKLVVFVLHGGKEPVLGTKATPSFSDIKGNWAESYIEYCGSTGIINGVGGDKFDPAGTLTGSQAAKMLLVAMGYNAKVFGLEGPDWDINTNVEANKAGLYEELTGIDPSATLTRDDAAQLIWNAVNGTLMARTWTLDTTTGKMTESYAPKNAAPLTLLADKFAMAPVAEGVLVDASYIAKVGDQAATFTYGIAADAAGNPADPSDAATLTLAPCEVDYTALLGHHVKVLYKVAANNDKILFGIYDTSKKVVKSTIGGLTGIATAGATKFKADGVTVTANIAVDTANTDNVFAFDNATHALVNAKADGTNEDLFKDLVQTGVNGYAPATTVEFISTRADSKLEWAIITPVQVGQVNYVGKDSITVNNSVGSFKFEDDIIYDGVAKGDFVSVIDKSYTVENMNHVSKVEIITGTVSGIKTGEALVDGTWYKTAAGVTGDALANGSEYDLAVIGGFIYNAKKISGEATLDDVLFVVASENATSLAGSSAKVYFVDGTNKIVTITKENGTTIPKDTAATLGMYTYKVNSSGMYEITAIDENNKLGHGGYVASTGNFDATNDKLANCYIADDAVVFLTHVNHKGTTSDTSDNTTSYKIMTGAEMKKWSNNYTLTGVAVDGTTPVGKALTDSVNGLATAKLLYLVGTDNSNGPTGGDGGKYGYIVTDPYKIKESGTEYMSYDMWTEDGVISVLDTETTSGHISTDLAKGNIVTYTQLSDGKVQDVDIVTTNANAVAVVGWDSKNIQVVNGAGSIVTTAAKLTSSTKYMYIDSSEVIGVDGGELLESTVTAGGTRLLNAFVVDDGTDKVLFIAIDVNNDLASLNGTTYTNGTLSAGVYTAAAGDAGYAVTFTDSVTGADVTVDKQYLCEGDTLTVNVVTTAGSGTVADDITIAGTATGIKTGSGADVTITIAADSAAGTQASGTWKIVRNAAATPVSTAITLEATGTVAV